MSATISEPASTSADTPSVPAPDGFAATMPADDDAHELALRQSLDRRVKAIQVRQAYDRLRESAVWSLGMAAIFVGFFLPFFPTTTGLAWFALLAVVQLLRLAGWQFFRRALSQGQPEHLWMRIFVVSAMVVGATWGAGPVLLMAGPGRVETMLPVVAVLCVSAVAVAQLASLWPALVAFLLSAMVPTVLTLALRGGPADQVAALAVLAGLVMLLLSGRASSRANESLIRAELENGMSLVRTRRLASDLARASAAREVESRRLSTIVDGTAAGTVEWDTRTGVLRLNERWAGMLGRTRAELEPLTVDRYLELVHPDDRATLEAAAGQHLKGEGDGVDRELRLAHRTGRWVWTQLNARVVSRDPEGRPLLISGVYLDITERKAAEQRWRSRAEMSADWFWETDASFRVTLLSDGGRQVLPIPHSELLGRTLAEVPALRPLEAGWGELARRLAAREAFSAFACEIEAPDGSRSVVELDGRPRHDALGSFVGYEGVGRDATERRRATESLRASLALVDALFQATPIPVVVKDTQGRYVRSNRAYAEMLEAKDQGVVSHVSQVVDREAAALHQSVDEALLVEPGVRRYEVRQQMNSGRVVDALVHKATLVDAQGQIKGLVGTLIDITEQRVAANALQAAKEAAESANRAKSAFLATMSHELRTPLNAVIGAAQLLRTLGDDPARRADLIHAIETSGATLLGLVENVMDLSRIEAGALEVAPAPFDLAECVEAALETVRVTAQAKGLALRANLSPEARGSRVGDAARLRQVLVNLLSNAVKFTAQGEVVVSAMVVDGVADRVRLEVRDTGIGVDAALQERIFEPFRQADEGTTRRYGGSGLGLAIVRQLVQAMGGTVGMHSAPGEGSRFTVELPLPRAARAPAEPAMQPGLLEGAAPGYRVLVVEDDPVNRTIVGALLEHAGCLADSSEDGASALHRMREQAYDVVLMDWQMPELDGLEVTRRVRRGEAGAAACTVPIVALTANAFAEDRLACLEAGMDDFLTKPVHAQALSAAVHRWAIVARQRRAADAANEKALPTDPSASGAAPA